MKDRSNEPRSYSGKLWEIGEPAERYIENYLKRKYTSVMPVGREKKRRDYLCSLNGKVELVEAKTDTKIANTLNIPWEIFRLEAKGTKCYISWGYDSKVTRVIYFVPQWLKIFDLQYVETQKAIFQYLMRKENLPIRHTLTDNDRITFFFIVPIGMLRAFGCLKEEEIAEHPLAPEIPTQGKLIR